MIGHGSYLFCEVCGEIIELNTGYMTPQAGVCSVCAIKLDVVLQTTNDWVSTFEKPENQNGFMWRMAAQGVLPDCVDPNDVRVISIVARAKHVES